MYIRPYSYNITHFITFCTRIYSPTIVASILTTINVPYFSAYDVTFFLYFLMTNNVSGYIITPLSQRYSTIIISPPVLWLPFYVTHFKLYFTSTIHYLCNIRLPSETVSCKMMYLHPFYPIYILRISPVSPTFLICYLSLSHM